MEEYFFSKVEGFSLQLYQKQHSSMGVFHGCTSGTKSHNASQQFLQFHDYSSTKQYNLFVIKVTTIFKENLSETTSLSDCDQEFERVHLKFSKILALMKHCEKMFVTKQFLRIQSILQHECQTRVKNFDFDKYTSENIFTPLYQLYDK